ncbi:MAG: CHAT domain-containing protein, partial [Chitinophagaceae bacterium]|nr:CHAT domain-containing protein [Chitinophagaceae bacterium]
TYTILSEQEKIALQHRNASQFSYLPSLLFTQGIHQPSLLQQVYATELALKGMVLEDQKIVLNSIRKSKDNAALQLYERWYSNKVFLGKQLLLPIKQRVAYLDSLEEATNQLEQQLSLESAAFRKQQQHLTPNDIAQKLKKGEAAIEFISFRIYNKKPLDSIMYAALVLVPGDSVVHFISLFEEKQLQRLLRSAADTTTYAAIGQLYGKKKTAKGVSDSLYQLIWKPLEKHLQGVQTIYYAPAGLLHHIAFQALSADSGSLLIDKYQLNQVLSTRSLAASAEITPKPQSAQIWGDIAYSDFHNAGNYSLASRKLSTRSANVSATTVSSFNLYTWDTKSVRGPGSEWRPLPSTKVEMDSLNRIFTSAGITPVMLSGSGATEEIFKAMSGKSPQVLHLATHGFFLPVKESKPKGNDLNGGDAFTMQQNPMFRSGLVLAGGNHTWKGETISAGKEDGILTAYEIAQLDLTGTDLVVLSACETALGDVSRNEGVIGLQRALKMAGVKQMIVSLWQVPDKATMELMTSFYKNWLSGQSTREALRRAQLQLKERYKHPYFWAAFVLVE